MALDLSADYLLIDDPVTLTYAVRVKENQWEMGVPVPYSQQRAVTKEDFVKSPMLLNKRTTVWHVWASQLRRAVDAGMDSKFAPKIGDKLTDGAVWDLTDPSAPYIVSWWRTDPTGAEAEPWVAIPPWRVWTVEQVEELDHDSAGPQRYRLVCIERKEKQGL